MNDLTWFLYLLDILGTLKDLSGTIVGFALIGGALIGSIGAFFLSMENGWEDCEYSGMGVKSFMQMVAKYTVFNKLIWLCLFVYAFVPSKNTMYLMAGSEIGEEVIESELGQKVQDYVIDLIDGNMGNE